MGWHGSQIPLKNKFKHDTRDYFMNVCGPLVGYPDESKNANGYDETSFLT